MRRLCIRSNSTRRRLMVRIDRVYTSRSRMLQLASMQTEQMCQHTPAIEGSRRSSGFHVSLSMTQRCFGLTKSRTFIHPWPGILKSIALPESKALHQIIYSLVSRLIGPRQIIVSRSSSGQLDIICSTELLWVLPREIQSRYVIARRSAQPGCEL